MHSDEYGLDTIHRLLIAGLTYLDRVCRENNIKYSLHGGALLGAERNGKLIPWDDDLDISMERAEYHRLISVIDKTNSKYYLNTESTWVPRLVIVDANQTAFIDIFIWDYITESCCGQKIKIALLRFLQGMMKQDTDYKRFNIKYRIILFLTYLIGHIFSWDTKICCFRYISMHCFTGNKKFIHRSNDSFKGVSFIFDKDYMSEYHDIQLEGHRFMVNKRYHEFLERNYGVNYLIPSPAIERKPMHGQSISHISKNIILNENKEGKI